METNEENLKELFDKFMDSGQAQDAANDIRAGEQILADASGPEPDKELIAQIKADVSKSLRSNRRVVLVRKVCAVAAAIIIIVGISTRLPIEHGRVSIETGSEVFFAEDAELEMLADEIDEIEDAFFALESSGQSDTGNDVIQLESELEEINGDFWKG